MRQVIKGDGTDGTAAAWAWLTSHQEPMLADLYLLGEPDDPRAIRVTSWPSPILWSPMGTFVPSTIKRGAVKCQVGLDPQTLDIEWSPQPGTPGSTISTATLYQLFAMGYYANWPLRIWTAIMATPGDADTVGCFELFGGWVGDVTIERGVIRLPVRSFLSVVTQKVPNNVIEATSTLGTYSGAVPPDGLASVAQCDVIAGGSPTMLVGRVTAPSLDHIFTTNVLRGGFLYFNAGGVSTLGGIWRAIQSNQKVTIGSDYNEIVLYAALPWAAVPGSDTFYVSGKAAMTPDVGATDSFPYVPDSSMGI